MDVKAHSVEKAVLQYLGYSIFSTVSDCWAHGMYIILYNIRAPTTLGHCISIAP